MFENEPDDVEREQHEEPMEAKPQRRKWTEDQKRAFVAECHLPGMSVWAVGQKYDIPPNQLFKWRKKFETDERTALVTSDSSMIDLQETIDRIKRLERLENIIIEKLADDIRRNQVTCYNASIAVSNLVTGLTKLIALTFEVKERLAAPNGNDQSDKGNEYGPDNPEHEVSREAEKMLYEMVKQKVMNDKAARGLST